MKAKRESAGILLYRFKESLEIFLVHPGGPFWVNKDEGVWTIPKGEPEEEEEPFDTAKREFEEETGQKITGAFTELKPVLQKAGKLVYAWAVEGDIDADAIRCNSFKVEWPPKSGKWKSYPEVDKAAWFSWNEAKEKINAAQTAFIDELVEILKAV
jgi:predicted NUDIX family NTP pyrophosphohydrolase